MQLSPEPQTGAGRAYGHGHHSPPARLETTKIPKDKPVSSAQDETKTVKSKGKEREAPQPVQAKVDHNKCIEDYIPSKHPALPVDHNECLDEHRGRAREQPAPLATGSSMNHAPHPPEEDSRTVRSHPVKKASTDHECEWKDKYMALQADVDAQERPGDIGLEGLTVVLHMQGRDDLVINTDLRNLQ